VKNGWKQCPSGGFILDRAEECLLAVVKDGRVYDSRWSKLEVDVRPKGRMIE